jgi:peptide deformylase
MKRRIHLYGDPILSTHCLPVINIDDTVEDIVLDMLDILKKDGGVGLAAPQIGEALRIIVIKEPDKEPLILINPEIREKSEETVKSIEGCLSIPGVMCEIQRPIFFDIVFKDIEGVEQAKHLEELEAQIFAHEYDHLEGRLIIDYLTPVRKSLIQKKLRKVLKYHKLITKWDKTNEAKLLNNK